MSKNHQSKEFRVMRSVVLWLHNFKCFICKTGASGLHVHHVNEISNDNEILNLIPLCSKCHKLIHRSTKLKKLSYKKIVVLLLNKVEYFIKRYHGK